MPGRELLVEHRNLATDAHDLTDQYLYGRACIGWKSIFVGQPLVGQLCKVGNAGLRDEAQFRPMRAQGIGENRALAHEQGPGEMGTEAGLMLACLEGQETHRKIERASGGENGCRSE